jgi:tetratricopeptide (TPR) repeat protein
MTPNPLPLAESARSRYPGTHPFSDSEEDRARFFGREDEAEQLHLRVLSVPLLVQFGRSGLGKTSLLQAGLFPRLREKPFLPVMVRLNAATESLTAAVTRSLQESCSVEGLEFVPGDTTGLWELLLTTSIWRGEFLLTPVLVFDQFEEVFTLRDAAFRAELAAELGAIATGKPPARLQGTAGRAVPSVKLVISLREDYLGELEEFSAAIPGLFHERLRLEAMSRKAAVEAIVNPARLETAPDGRPYSSPRFELDEPVLNEMIGAGVIEPFQLQLLCGHAEAVAKAKGGAEPVTLTANDFKGSQQFASVLKNFYRDTLHRLSPPSQRKRAAALCEDGLLDGDGHRLMLHEAQILAGYGVKREPLDTLCNARLIRSERRFDRTFYEISHDRVAESIVEARRNRLPTKVRRAMWLAGTVTLIVIAVAVAWQISVDKERKATERLLAFLLGNSFLGEIRDTGRSSMMVGVREQVREIEADRKAPKAIRALALRHAGDVEHLAPNLQRALERHREALALFEELGDARNVVESHRRIGDVLSFQGRPSEALKEYEAAISQWRGIIAAPDATVDDCVDLASMILDTAWFHDAAGRNEAAASTTGEAVAIATNVLFGGPGPCAGKRRELSPYPHPGAISVLSTAARVRALLPESIEDARATATLAARASAMKPYSVGARKAAIVSIGDRGHQQPTPEEQIDDYTTALRAFEELWRLDPDNILARRERAVTQLMLAAAIVACHEARASCAAAHPLSDADSMVLDSLAVLRNLAATDAANALFHNDIAWALSTHARVLLASGRPEESLARLQEAERHYDQRKLDPDDQNILLNLASYAHAQVSPLLLLKRLADAEAQARRASAMYERLLSAHRHNPVYLGSLAAVRGDEAFFMEQRGDTAGAAKAAEHAKALRDQVNSQRQHWLDTLNKNTERDTAHYETAVMLRLGGDAKGALRELTSSERLSRDYIVLRPAAYQSYDSLAITYRALADVHEMLGNQDARLEALTAAMHAAQIGLWLASQENSANVTLRLLQVRKTLATRLYELKQFGDAESILQEHIIVTEQAVRAAGNTDFVAILGHAKCLLGSVRLESNQTGWEEAFRSGLIHLETVARGPDEATMFDVGSWRAVLADALEKSRRVPEAMIERRRALAAYRDALKRDPTNREAQEAIAALEKKI